MSERVSNYKTLSNAVVKAMANEINIHCTCNSSIVHLHTGESEHTNGVIRIRKSKDRQHNDQKKKDNNELQNTIQKTKDRKTRTSLKPGVNSGVAEG